MKLYIVMPAYNERDNIQTVIEEWYPIIEACGPDCRLIIANDGSKDNTFQIMKSVAKDKPLFIPLDKSNSGHGATVMHLYKYALDNGADYIFQTDSDGQTRPEEFWSFWNDKDKYELQIGTRYARQDGLGRIVVTKTLKFIIWLMFGVVVKDANTPFRLIKSETLKDCTKLIPSDFFLSNVALSAIAVKQKRNIGWKPITFRPRQGGVNSINMKRIFKIGLKALSDFKIIRKNLNI